MDGLDLKGRIRRVRDSLAACALCDPPCGVDRRAGPAGRCGLDDRGIVFFAGLSLCEEPEITPAFEVWFRGCDRRCAFCQVADAVACPDGPGIPVEDVVRGFEAVRGRARTLSFVGGEPTASLLEALRILSRIDDPPPVVWNSNMTMGPLVHEVLDGVAACVVADVHFAAPACAAAMGGDPDDFDRAFANIRRASSYARVLVRHLALPGHEACCRAPIERRVRDELPGLPFRILEDLLVPSTEALDGDYCEEIVIGPDGRVVIKHLTPAMARIARALDPRLDTVGGATGGT
jgi:uncharacterized Fe-S radical SAM superfamily protein PflX